VPIDPTRVSKQTIYAREVDACDNFACPYCGAAKGHWCRIVKPSLWGRLLADHPHAARMRLLEERGNT
jgi:hypothetical protein